MFVLASGVTWHLNSELRLFANYAFTHAGSVPQHGDAHIFQARSEIGI